MPDERWYDASVLLRPGTPEWPGDSPFDCRWSWRIAEGASVNLSAMSGSPHVGTHADAPLHVRDGAPASHDLPVEAFIGEAWVADVRHVTGEITLAALRLPDERRIPRLLLRTGRDITGGRFPDAWPSLSVDAIDALHARGLRLVGTDAPSVDDRESKDLRIHHRIFDGGAYVLENLDLRGVESGAWHLMAPPLRIEGLDAAPVRALLKAPSR